MKETEITSNREYSMWQKEHPMEARILELVDEEDRHSLAARYIPRRARLLENTQEERRSLGLRDELVDYVIGYRRRLEDRLAQDQGLIRSPEEKALVFEINRGFLLRFGNLTQMP